MAEYIQIEKKDMNLGKKLSQMPYIEGTLHKCNYLPMILQ